MAIGIIYDWGCTSIWTFGFPISRDASLFLMKPSCTGSCGVSTCSRVALLAREEPFWDEAPNSAHHMLGMPIRTHAPKDLSGNLSDSVCNSPALTEQRYSMFSGFFFGIATAIYSRISPAPPDADLKLGSELDLFMVPTGAS